MSTPYNQGKHFHDALIYAWENEITASWQDPVMGSAYHDLYGGSEKHDAVPELFEDGWKAALSYLENRTNKSAP